jgi:5-methyltetrahydropteroyltriglutamate--homocysteine methyltransferase
MAIATNLGFSRIGANRQLKKALEAYWAGTISAPDLSVQAGQIRREHWALQRDAGLDQIPTGDFSLYDHVLDTAVLLNAIPPRFQNLELNSHLDLYFSMARGSTHNGGVPALEMTKWFDTNYHYLVPEFHQDQEFRLARLDPVEAYREATQLGYRARPVILGPVSFLRLGKTKGTEFRLLELLDSLLPAYEELLAQFAAAGAEWLQIDEPVLVLDLDEETRAAFPKVFTRFARSVPALKILLAAYFGSLEENLPLALSLPVSAVHLDLVRAEGQLDRVLSAAPSHLAVSLGLVDGRNIWKTDLNRALNLAERVASALSCERILLSPSCSLLHVPVDLAFETKLDPEVKDWLSFGKQKLEEVVLLTRALNEGRESVRTELERNAESLARRRSSRRVMNPAVRRQLAAIQAGHLVRKSSYPVRAAVQRRKLQLPVLPTTTIGSFPQTPELRRQRARMRRGEASAEEYQLYLRKEIEHTIVQQEKLDLDVLVHGEAERNDMVEYFGELLDGFAFTQNGWVQSYGSRCVKPPIIVGDIERRAPMTVDWWRYAQSLTDRPVKGMLTGPVTILQWSFVRDDQPRRETCRQLALAIRGETLDLETAGCRIIQIDEPALREGLPLRKAEAADYLRWAVDAFRLASSGVRDETQIHTHMCYAEFNEIIEAIAEMDADVLSIESARSQMELLSAFAGHRYGNEIGPGVYDIHSPRVPSVEEIAGRLSKALQVIPPEHLWVNPDCGLKTRRWEEVSQALSNMVAAAKILRGRLDNVTTTGS